MTDLTARLTAALAGRYAIESELGKGGMATVFLASDLKHDRRVAIKVLKPELAAVIGGERFLTEIRTTANLQHPHILALFDSGEADGFLYYVMPYVEGETLRGWIDREKQLAVDDAVRVTKAVANALQYAHEHDVIHRDIKPENILIHAGEPVVADFGIALAISAAGGGRMTETGLSLGTPHYMSPEQATADRDLSARSDVYSLACVLYEMLAGAPPHAAPTAQASLMKILTEDPRPVLELRRSVPEHISAAITKALEKLPADRFESAEAFKKALDDTEFRFTPTVRTAAATAQRVEVREVRRGIPVWAAVGVGAVMLAAGVALTRALQPGPEFVPSAEFSLIPDTSHTVAAPCCGRSVAISASGDRVVYQGVPVGGGGVYLYQRPLNQRRARQIPGTQEARHPFFSPDGEWVGFFSRGSLLKVRFDGGTPLSVLSGLGTVAGGSWAPDNTIVYAERGVGEGLFRVSADGGVPEPLTVVDTAAGEFFHRWPHVLPDGRSVVFAVLIRQEGGAFMEMLAITPLEGGGHRTLAPGADPRYVDSGHLVYSDAAGSIMAQPFAPTSGAFTGPRFRIAERATYRGAGTGQSEYDISRNGTLIYRENTSVSIGQEDLVLVGMDGNAETLYTTGPMRQPRFSPDGRYVAFEEEGDGDAPDDIWVWDQVRSNPIRVTFEDDNSLPAWSADGSRIFFDRGGSIYSRAADGSGDSELVHETGTGIAYSGASHDGGWLVWSQPGEVGRDIWGKPLDPAGEARPIIASSFENFSPAISPDGRWIAYTSYTSSRSPTGGPASRSRRGGVALRCGRPMARSCSTGSRANPTNSCRSM